MEDIKPLALLIEDDDEALDLRVDVLKKSGFEVLGSTSTFDALKRVTKSPEIDILITDICLNPSDPKDKSGLDLAEIVKKIQPGLPIIGYSSIYSESDLSSSEAQRTFTKVYSKKQSEKKSFSEDLIRNAAQYRNRRKIVEDKPLPYDVFVSYNSKDLKTVQQLYKELINCGLKVWFDREELPPGSKWQDEIEKMLQTASAVIVAVANNGLGPWQEREVRLGLSQLVKRGVRVIPVLLPEAPKDPKLPAFLTEFTWLDMRKGIAAEHIDRLKWGITGMKR